MLVQWSQFRLSHCCSAPTMLNRSSARKLVSFLHPVSKSCWDMMFWHGRWAQAKEKTRQNAKKKKWLVTLWVNFDVLIYFGLLLLQYFRSFLFFWVGNDTCWSCTRLFAFQVVKVIALQQQHMLRYWNMHQIWRWLKHFCAGHWSPQFQNRWPWKVHMLQNASCVKFWRMCLALTLWC